MRLCLFVDTCIHGANIAIADLESSQDDFWMKSHGEKYGSATSLSQLWQEGLKELDIKYNELDAIAVSVGPGSFTGIKIGLSWCYGVEAANAAKIKWLSLSSIEEAVNFWYLKQAQTYTLFLPSTKTHGYIAYKNSDMEQAQSCLVDTGSMQTPWGSVAALCEGAEVLWGADWPQMQAQLSLATEQKKSLLSKELLDAAMRGMIHKGKRTPEEQLMSEAPQAKYLRKSTAEENLAKKKGTS